MILSNKLLGYKLYKKLLHKKKKELSNKDARTAKHLPLANTRTYIKPNGIIDESSVTKKIHNDMSTKNNKEYNDVTECNAIKKKVNNNNLLSIGLDNNSANVALNTDQKFVINKDLVTNKTVNVSPLGIEKYNLEPNPILKEHKVLSNYGQNNMDILNKGHISNNVERDKVLHLIDEYTNIDKHFNSLDFDKLLYNYKVRLNTISIFEKTKAEFLHQDIAIKIKQFCTKKLIILPDFYYDDYYLFNVNKPDVISLEKLFNKYFFKYQINNDFDNWKENYSSNEKRHSAYIERLLDNNDIENYVKLFTNYISNDVLISHKNHLISILDRRHNQQFNSIVNNLNYIASRIYGRSIKKSIINYLDSCNKASVNFFRTYNESSALESLEYNASSVEIRFMMLEDHISNIMNIKFKENVSKDRYFGIYQYYSKNYIMFKKTINKFNLFNIDSLAAIKSFIDILIEEINKKKKILIREQEVTIIDYVLHNKLIEYIHHINTEDIDASDKDSNFISIKKKFDEGNIMRKAKQIGLIKDDNCIDSKIYYINFDSATISNSKRIEAEFKPSAVVSIIEQNSNNLVIKYKPESKFAASMDQHKSKEYSLKNTQHQTNITKSVDTKPSNNVNLQKLQAMPLKQSSNKVFEDRLLDFNGKLTTKDEILRNDKNNELTNVSGYRNKKIEIVERTHQHLNNNSKFNAGHVKFEQCNNSNMIKIGGTISATNNLNAIKIKSCKNVLDAKSDINCNRIIDTHNITNSTTHEGMKLIYRLREREAQELKGTLSEVKLDSMPNKATATSTIHLAEQQKNQNSPNYSYSSSVSAKQSADMEKAAKQKINKNVFDRLLHNLVPFNNSTESKYKKILKKVGKLIKLPYDDLIITRKINVINTYKISSTNKIYYIYSGMGYTKSGSLLKKGCIIRKIDILYTNNGMQILEIGMKSVLMEKQNLQLTKALKSKSNSSVNTTGIVAHNDQVKNSNMMSIDKYQNYNNENKKLNGLELALYNCNNNSKTTILNEYNDINVDNNKCVEDLIHLNNLSHTATKNTSLIYTDKDNNYYAKSRDNESNKVNYDSHLANKINYSTSELASQHNPINHGNSISNSKTKDSETKINAKSLRNDSKASIIQTGSILVNDYIHKNANHQESVHSNSTNTYENNKNAVEQQHLQALDSTDETNKAIYVKSGINFEEQHSNVLKKTAFINSSSILHKIGNIDAELSRTNNHSSIENEIMSNSETKHNKYNSSILTNKDVNNLYITKENVTAYTVGSSTTIVHDTTGNECTKNTAMSDEAINRPLNYDLNIDNQYSRGVDNDFSLGNSLKHKNVFIDTSNSDNPNYLDTNQNVFNDGLNEAFEYFSTEKKLVSMIIKQKEQQYNITGKSFNSYQNLDLYCNLSNIAGKDITGNSVEYHETNNIPVNKEIGHVMNVIDTNESMRSEHIPNNTLYKSSSLNDHQDECKQIENQIKFSKSKEGSEYGTHNKSNISAQESTVSDRTYGANTGKLNIYSEYGNDFNVQSIHAERSQNSQQFDKRILEVITKFNINTKDDIVNQTKRTGDITKSYSTAINADLISSKIPLMKTVVKLYNTQSSVSTNKRYIQSESSIKSFVNKSIETVNESRLSENNLESILRTNISTTFNKPVNNNMNSLRTDQYLKLQEKSKTYDILDMNNILEKDIHISKPNVLDEMDNKINNCSIGSEYNNKIHEKATNKVNISQDSSHNSWGNVSKIVNSDIDNYNKLHLYDYDDKQPVDRSISSIEYSTNVAEVLRTNNIDSNIEAHTEQTEVDNNYDLELQNLLNKTKKSKGMPSVPVPSVKSIMSYDSVVGDIRYNNNKSFEKENKNIDSTCAQVINTDQQNNYNNVFNKKNELVSNLIATNMQDGNTSSYTRKNTTNIIGFDNDQNTMRIKNKFTQQKIKRQKTKVVKKKKNVRALIASNLPISIIDGSKLIQKKKVYKLLSNYLHKKDKKAH